jgi:hypothetical protein
MSLGILDLGGAFTSPPVALGGVGGSGTLDVFGQGTDNAFYHKAWNGSAWVPSSPNQWDAVNGQGLGRLNGRPAVVSPSANRIDVFGQGTDGAVYHKANLGSGWPAGWDFVGGVFNGPPTVVLRGSTFEIFGRGTDGNYYRQSWSGSGGFSNSWEGPLFPGDALISEPTVVSNGSSMDLFGQNAAGRYEVRTWTPSGWSLNVYLLPGVYIGPPVAAWQGGHPGLLDVVGQGTNTYYYHVQRVNGVWSGLDGASGGAGFGAGTLLPISSGTQLWVEGTDHNYYVNTITGSSWSGFSGGGGSGMMH